jgi:hypothetical protein
LHFPTAGVAPGTGSPLNLAGAEQRLIDSLIWRNA